MILDLRRILSILFILAFFISCNKDEPEWVPINSTFILELNEQVKVIENNNRALYVSVVEIEDSRCPSDLVCVRAGEASVKVIIEDTRNSQFNTLLCIGDCSPSIKDIRSFVFYNIEYTIQLIEVNPYPTSINEDENMRIVLKLFKN